MEGPGGRSIVEAGSTGLPLYACDVHVWLGAAPQVEACCASLSLDDRLHADPQVPARPGVGARRLQDRRAQGDDQGRSPPGGQAGARQVHACEAGGSAAAAAAAGGTSTPTAGASGLPAGGGVVGWQFAALCLPSCADGGAACPAPWPLPHSPSLFSGRTASARWRRTPRPTPA